VLNQFGSIYSGFHINGALAELMGTVGQSAEFWDHPSAKIAGTYLFFSFFFEIKMQLYEIKLLFAWATWVLGNQ